MRQHGLLYSTRGHAETGAAEQTVHFLGHRVRIPSQGKHNIARWAAANMIAVSTLERSRKLRMPISLSSTAATPSVWIGSIGRVDTVITKGATH
jgi:hypothetical protein